MLVRSLVLMSTMSAAADVLSGMAQRRRGQDPAALEAPDVALAHLRDACEELEEHVITLRAARVLDGDDADGGRTCGSMVRFARRVNEMLLLNRLVRLMHSVHQRLLSLYPAVPEDLVEEARRLETILTDARDAGDGGATLQLLERTADFSGHLRRVVSGS